uniref:Cyclin n=1 Tax=Leersia perrieri TaxID=77586 RepID=A0A0D9VBM4_9ORYZ
MERRRMRRMGSNTNASSSAGAAAAAPAPKVVAVLAGLLERAAARGDADEGTPAAAAAATAFRGRARPEISVRRYAERIYRYAGCSSACFVVARVYLDRLAGRRPEEEEDRESSSSSPAAAAASVVVDSYSVHRLLITSVMVAAKFMDDIHYNNAYFARVGGVEVAEMNGLELELLFALRFRLNVTPATFAAYCAALEGEMVAADCPLPPPISSPSPEEEEENFQASRRNDGGAKNVAVADSVGRSAMLAAAHHRVVVEITH